MFLQGYLHLSWDILTERHLPGNAVRVTNTSRLLLVVLPGAGEFVQGPSPEQCALLLKVYEPLQNHFEKLVIDFFIFQERKARMKLLFLQVAGYEAVCELDWSSIKINKHHLEKARSLS
jgi:hypothetical protein